MSLVILIFLMIIWVSKSDIYFFFLQVFWRSYLLNEWTKVSKISLRWGLLLFDWMMVVSTLLLSMSKVFMSWVVNYFIYVTKRWIHDSGQLFHLNVQRKIGEEESRLSSERAAVGDRQDQDLRCAREYQEAVHRHRRRSTANTILCFVRYFMNSVGLLTAMKLKLWWIVV
jgi:hypothetical protein